MFCSLIHAFVIVTVVFVSELVYGHTVYNSQDALRQVRLDIKKTTVKLTKVNHLRDEVLTKLSLEQLSGPIKKANVNNSLNNYLPYVLTEKDYLRYPAAEYPAYFKFDSNHGANELEFHVWLQTDQDIFFNASDYNIFNGLIDGTNPNASVVDRLWIRRLRPSMEGTLANYFNFLINPDFGLTQSRIFDAFLDINYLRILGLQTGLQMSLVSGIENYFDNFSYLSRAYTMEMSNPAMMAPDREFGIVLHGSLGPSGHEPYYRGLSYLGFDDMFSYQVGIFNGTPDNSNPGVDIIDTAGISGFNGAFSTSGSKAVEARVFFNPFLDKDSSVLQHLGFGFAGSYENVLSEFNLPPLVSIGQNQIFSLAAEALGPRSRLHPQAIWYAGPMGILTDWAQTNQGVCGTDDIFTVSKCITQKSRSSQIQFIYNLTQEDFNLFHLEPNNNFHPFVHDAYGAWQMVMRFTSLNIDKNIFQPGYLYFPPYPPVEVYPYANPTESIQKSNSWSIGVNWYWTMAIRFTAEYARTEFTGGHCLAYSYSDCLKITNRPAENIFMQRFQVSF